MARVLDGQRTDASSVDGIGQPIVAHLRGGPFDGHEQVLYRARSLYSPRVSRGFVRRSLRMSRRYAWYELQHSWEEDGLLHGEYEFDKIRARPVPAGAATVVTA